MNYHNITKDDMRNGDGLRVVLWVAGCEHHCRNCQNPVTWDYTDGKHFSIPEYEEIQKELDKPYISGLTISGGDPLHPANRQETIHVCDVFHHLYPKKTIWVYTGYTWEQLRTMGVDMVDIDVLVDGQFKEELKDVNYHWAGSTNQRVINVKKSLKEGRVVLHEDN